MKQRVKNISLLFGNLANAPLQRIDAWILIAFTALITYQPFYLMARLDVVEWGIYLPGVQAFSNGQMPYRDFFHLRGPLEIVLPGLLMKMFGQTIAVYSTYFYIGTLLTLIFLVLIGRQIYRTRLIFYLMTFMVVAKTFPRVVFYLWGGIRYGWGILALLFAIISFNKRRPVHMILAGISTGLAFLTSAEIGICAITGITAGIIFSAWAGLSQPAEVRKNFLYYGAGALIIMGPFLSIMLTTHSLNAYLNSLLTVATRMIKVFPDSLLADHPETIPEIMLTFLNPCIGDFKYLTLGYCYLFLIGYFIFKICRRELTTRHIAIVAIAFYGFLLYALSFRKIGAAQFEMAMQPEKLLLFFLCEEAYVFLRDKLRIYCRAKPRWPAQKMTVLKILGISFLIFAFIISTIIPAFVRYNKRFPAAQLLFGQSLAEVQPLKGEPMIRITSGKAAGLTVPLYQAQDIAMLTEFFNGATKPDEAVLMFPEYGAFNFIINRPFVGRFPNVTFSWMNDRWHQEILAELKQNPPRYATMPKKLEATIKCYLLKKENFLKYQEVRNFIEEHYVPEISTPTQIIYRHK